MHAHKKASTICAIYKCICMSIEENRAYIVSIKCCVNSHITQLVAAKQAGKPFILARIVTVNKAHVSGERVLAGKGTGCELIIILFFC